jgi:p-methyltransferase
LRGESTAHETRFAPTEGRLKTNSLTLAAAQAPTVRTDHLDHIPNLIFLRGGRIVRTPSVPESNDMDVFNTNWEDVDPDRFTPTAPTRTARSCAFSCSFCRYPIIAGPLNLTSIDVVERQFDLFQARGVKQVVIIDDTFNVPLPRFKDLLRMMIRRKYDFEWFSYFRAANSDDECFDLMERSRCGGVFLGIESGDQSILDAMNKSSRVDRYVKSIHELGRRGVVTFASLIVGFPGETEKTIQNTIDFIRDAQPMYYRAELYYHGLNSPIHERATELGLRGAGYSWRHNTMDWQTASQHVEYMYRTIDTSLMLPLYMFDFWGIPYLLGQGITRDAFQRFTRAADRILQDELNGLVSDAAAHLDDLAAIFDA